MTGVLRRELAVDFQTATSAGIRGLSDLEVLAFAAAEGRVLVSHDRRTMPQAFGKFILSKASPGLFLISQKTDVLVAIESVLLAWTASEHEEWINRILTLPF